LCERGQQQSGDAKKRESISTERHEPTRHRALLHEHVNCGLQGDWREHGENRTEDLQEREQY
jgi:hypothetical protein